MRGFLVKRGGGVSKRRGTRKRLTSKKKSNAKKQVPKVECNETLSPNDGQEEEVMEEVEDAIPENQTVDTNNSDDVDDSLIPLTEQDVDAIIDIIVKHRANIRKQRSDETQLESDKVVGNDQNGETSEELNNIGVDNLSPPHLPEHITGDCPSNSNSPVVEHVTGDSAKPTNAPLENVIENARPTRRRKSATTEKVEEDKTPATLAATRTRRSITSKRNSPYLVEYELLPKSKRTFECDMCEKSFFRKQDFEQHHSYHFEPKIACPKCDKLMHNKAQLHKHVKSHVEVEKKTPKPRARTQKTR